MTHRVAIEKGRTSPDRRIALVIYIEVTVLDLIVTELFIVTERPTGQPMEWQEEMSWSEGEGVGD